MIFRVLGQLAIGDGRVALPTGHQLTVLAVLLINPNRRVSRAELMRWAWGATEVRPTQLDKQASYVRTFLASLPGEHHLVTYKGFGYELRVAEAEHDMLSFEKLIRDAEGAGDDEAVLLRRALRFWRGRHPLEGVPGEIGVTLGAELISRRKRALVRLCDLEFARGRHAEVLDDLRHMVGYHPTDKRLTEQLMLALHHNGHATEALEVYDGYAAALEAAAGATPDPGLRELNSAIALGDDEAVALLSGYERRRSVRAANLGVTPRQLPPAPANFVGRGEVVQEVQWLLSRIGSGPRVVVLTGPGGIGKTALAVHVAHRVRDNYPDGQLFVELGGTRVDPVPTEEVLAQVLRAFGVALIPNLREERVALLRSVLSDKRVLLILDDAHDEAQVEALIPGNPGCAVLVSARQRLPLLAGAHHVPALLPLDRDEAMDLYQRVVRDAGVRVTAAGGVERLAAARIVDLCAGLPLAVWVAAALRGEDGGPSAPELAARLADQPLTSLVFRDRSVARTIGAGIDRLDSSARTLFLGLGLLPMSDIAPWMAAAVLTGIDTDPFEALRQLAGRYLIRPAGEGRYRFHELTHDLAGVYARDDLVGQSWRNVVIERVYRALLTLVRRAHRALYGGDYEVVHGDTPPMVLAGITLEGIDRAPMTWFESERQNIRAAVRHCCELGLTEIAWELAVSSHEFYNRRGYLDDWAATHQMALAACRQAGNVRGEAALLAALGQPALVTGRRPGVSGIEDLERSAQLFRQADDVHGEAIALRTLGNALRHAGRFEEALDAFRSAVRGYAAAGDLLGRWQALRYLGQIHLDLGRPERAVSLLREAEAAAREFAQPLLQAQTAYWLGRACLETGDEASARKQFLSVLALVDDADEVGVAWGHFGLGELALATGNHVEADRHLSIAAQMAGHAGDALLEGRIALSQAALYQSTGRIGEAQLRLNRAISSFAAADADHLRSRAEGKQGTLQGHALEEREAHGPPWQ